MRCEEFLRDKTFFKDLSDYEFMKISQLARRRFFPKDCVIVEEAGRGNNLYFIMSGSARVTRRAETGDEELISDLYPGEYFGEISFVDNGPRSATVIANEDSEVIEFNGNLFLKLLNDDRDIGFKVYRALTQIFCYRLRDTTDYLALFLSRNKWDVQ
jgi:CRP-like cAMP-binding protein